LHNNLNHKKLWFIPGEFSWNNSFELRVSTLGTK